jgi:hypothetical protein
MRVILPTKSDPLATSRALAQLLDSAFTIPGTRLRVGLDALLGLLPVIGDLIGAVLSGHIVATAARLGVPKPVLRRMSLNIMIDTVVGAIPLVGDFFDAVWKANLKNVALMERALADPEGTRQASSRLFFLVGLLCVLFVVGVTVLGLWAFGMLRFHG